MRLGKRRAFEKNNPLDQLTDPIEKAETRIRAKVEHPFRVIKRQLAMSKPATVDSRRTRHSGSLVCPVQFMDRADKVASPSHTVQCHAQSFGLSGLIR